VLLKEEQKMAKNKTVNTPKRLIVVQNATTVDSGKMQIVRGKARGGGAAKKGLGYNVSPN
jgi:hypothetical protein